MFRAKNPCLSNGKVIVNLHVDVEPKKTDRSGYPIEKRGVYYLARSLSSQLSLITDETDYNHNIGNYVAVKKDGRKQAYDLLKVVIIRLGDKIYHGKEGDEGFELLRFLSAVMYPNRQDFMDAISEYIDFSDNEELWKEAEHMGGLGQSILEEVIFHSSFLLYWTWTSAGKDKTKIGYEKFSVIVLTLL